MFRTYATALAVAGALFMAGAAGATEPTVVDQYTEQVPTPGGEKPSNEATPANKSNGSGGGGSNAVVPGGTTGSETGGGDSSGSPATAGGGGGAGGGNGNGAPGGSAERSPAGPDTSTGGTGSAKEADSDGMGLLFPLILAACLVVVVAIFIGRRRMGSQAA